MTPPPPPGYSPQPGSPSPVLATKTNGMSIASLVTSIVGLLIPCFGFVPGAIGLIFGIIGRKQIAASGGRQSGRGLALAGIIIGAIALVVWLGLWLLLFVAGDCTRTGNSWNCST